MEREQDQQPQAGGSCTTGDGRSGFYVSTSQGLQCYAGDTVEDAQQAAAAAAGQGATRPARTEEERRNG